jgi:putative ABC transport system permease protein
MLHDLRYAFRQLVQNPGFTLVAVLTLGLGIGACTAIFSVVNGILLRPLDYPAAERIMVVKESSLPDFPEFSVSPPNFLDWQHDAKSFASLAAIRGARLNFTGEGEPQRLVGAKATAHYFEVYGLQPALGRFWLPSEDALGKEHVVVLSYTFWQRFYAGAASVLGRSIQLNGEPYTIIGVAPLGFGQSSKLDAWTPMAFTAEEAANGNRGAHYISVVGRLRPDVTAAQADAEVKILAARLAAQYVDTNKGWSAFVQPLLDYTVRDVRGVLYTLFAAVGCVLLIACANVASLFLARAAARHRELSVRAALGAGHARLVRQLLTESVVLALVGGATGVLFAAWGLATLLHLAPASLPRATNVSLDPGVLGFALVLSLGTGILFGIAPAWFATRTNVNDALKHGARGSTDGGRRSRLRRVLVAFEVAACVVLLSGAGLLLRSFARLTSVVPGFSTQNAVAVRLALPEKKYPTPVQQAAFASATLERIRALPGVDSVGVANTVPLIGDWVLNFEIQGRPVAPSDQPSANYYAVSGDYFRAMGIRLIRGRVFNAHDDASAPRVAVVNETFARTFFPGEDVIGRRISISDTPQVWREIVGVVADVTQYGPDRASTAQMYEPFAQKPFSSLSFIVRTTGPIGAVTSQLRPAVYAVDPTQPVGSIQPLEEILAGAMARQRFTAVLLTAFSAVALAIAVIGIYGMMAYTVSQRTGEIGVRMALGARPGDVLRLILSDGGKIVGAGMVAGLMATLLSSRAIQSQLFQTSTFDGVALTIVLGTLALAAAVACLLPARRAARIDPVVALRGD